MKHSFLFLTLLFLTIAPTISQTQSEFVIGAEWLNMPKQGDGVPNGTITPQDWVNMQDLGLNWGMVGFNYYNPTFDAINTLTAAAQHNIKLMLERYRFRISANGQRWEYHPEFIEHYPSFSGRTGEALSSSEDSAGRRYPDDVLSDYVSWRAKAGIHNPGYIAKNLTPNNEQKDSTTYYVKVRMRLAAGTPLTHTPVVTVKAVRLSDSYEKTAIIYADQFGTNYDYTYKEMTAFTFYKSASGPFEAPNQEEYNKSIQPLQMCDTIGLATGVPDAIPNGTFTPFDYQVYWNGSVTCNLDFVIIDDYSANNTFTGVWDGNISTEVNLFKDSAALGKFKISDEPYYSNWLCVGYVENKIKSIVNPTSPTKTGSHYSSSDVYTVGPTRIRRNIAQTQTRQNISDIYLLNSTAPMPDHIFYDSVIQYQYQHYLIDFLRWNIQASNIFNIPFWFTPQLHSLIQGDTLLKFREPTTLEIRAMVNLGIAYGAKGILYFLYRSLDPSVGFPDHYDGLVNLNGTPRTTIYAGTSYAGNKWEMVKSINQKLKILGPTLLSLTWQNAYSIHLGQPSGTFVTNVSTIDQQSNRYVELAFFKDNSNVDYIMVVNRRSAPNELRDISIALNNFYTNWKVTNVETGEVTVLAGGSSFTDHFLAGEGKLYKLENAEWSGVVTLRGNIHVLSGATLTVQDGTILLFDDNTTMYCAGNLLAQGTSSRHIIFTSNKAHPASGDWLGITLGEMSHSELRYCDIAYAQTGLTLDNAELVAENNSIHNCAIGISANHYGFVQMSPAFINNEIYHCTYGLSFNGDNWMELLGNVIYENDIGVFVSTSSPLFHQNRIENNFKEGVYCVERANPRFGDIVKEDRGYNIIRYNGSEESAQIYARDAYPFLGNIYEAVEEGGYNSIISSNEHQPLVKTEEGHGELHAQNNWWGNYPPRETQFQSDGNIEIRYEPALEYDPNQQKANTVKFSRSEILTNAIDIEGTGGSGGQFTLTPEQKMLRKAIGFRGERKYIPAINLYIQLITSKPMAKEAETAIRELRTTYRDFMHFTKNDSAKQTLLHRLQNYLQTHSNPKIKFLAQQLLAHEYRTNGDVNNAINSFQNIINTHPNSEEECSALYSLLCLYVNDIGNKTEAENILSQLQTKYPSDHRTVIAAIQLASLPHTLISKASQAKNEVEIQQRKESPQSFSLEQNYPNPFNPSTTIHYTIPENIFVSLKVYDVLGREIVSLVNSYEEAGFKSVEFDATNLPSGIYIYKLAAGKFVEMKKMIVIK